MGSSYVEKLIKCAKPEAMIEAVAKNCPIAETELCQTYTLVRYFEYLIFLKMWDFRFSQKLSMKSRKRKN